MLLLTTVAGLATDPMIAGQLHDIAHGGGLERITLPPGDLARRRFRAVTDRGTECGVALPRDAALQNGSVLLLEANRAIVLGTSEEAWLTLRPKDAEAALALGYHAGNLHWRVRFAGPLLRVALDGPRQAYLDRLALVIADGNVTVLDDGHDHAQL
jgi:urease accessory protein